MLRIETVKLITWCSWADKFMSKKVSGSLSITHWNLKKENMKELYSKSMQMLNTCCIQLLWTAQVDYVQALSLDWWNYRQVHTNSIHSVCEILGNPISSCKFAGTNYKYWHRSDSYIHFHTSHLYCLLLFTTVDCW